MSSGLAARTFRANPHYELTLLDRLGPADRAALGELESRSDTYGLLRPRPESGLELRPASMEVALLFLTLERPQPLPAYVRAQLGDDLDRSIGRLVLDGVLEIEDEGAYVCGARAGELVLSSRSEGGRGRIGEVSVAALRYAQELADLPAPLLALRLYFYGRRPVSPGLQRQLPDESALASYLGIAPGGTARAALDAGWRAVPSGGEPRYWRTWRRRSVGRAMDGAWITPYKLYVSPAIDALAGALGAVAESLAEVPGVTAFKVGADLPGICRPDKLVVYFNRLDDLQRGAAQLEHPLKGCPAHGVPFTAPVTADGLLSWGADPPAPSALEGETLTSWRMWVTERLAEYLVVARDGSAGTLEPWEFALERLRLSGIDTDTWAPGSDMWPEALASA
ncbi:MAG TPA: hypothetical protein VF072_11795 [Thermoleophilaceae bacterium]